MNKLSILVLLISAFLLSKNLMRDLLLAEQRVGDLRNRIVGARLQKEGLSPYFYKWRKGDSIRYYDPLNEDQLRVSACTASPFLHVLLYPITGLTYPVASKVWVFVLYGMLVIAAICSSILSKKNLLPVACFICVGFTFTETWFDTVVTKQSYLFIPFFAMLIYFFMKRGEKNETVLYDMRMLFNCYCAH